MLAIEVAGGVYCSLSPQDPEHRLHNLVQQTQSQLVLVHHLTKTKFDYDVVSINTDSVLINSSANSDVDIAVLSYMMVSSNNVAYIVFTSGSTGTPKAVRCSCFCRLQLEFLIFF
jgi:non-ribosomal peptide synthetase component F